MEQQGILAHIESLVAEEERLYAQGQMGESERARLQSLQVELDRCWDLLRQRKALRSAGKDPDQAEVRSESTVEKYLQ